MRDFATGLTKNKKQSLLCEQTTCEGVNSDGESNELRGYFFYFSRLQSCDKLFMVYSSGFDRSFATLSQFSFFFSLYWALQSTYPCKEVFIGKIKVHMVSKKPRIKRKPYWCWCLYLSYKLSVIIIIILPHGAMTNKSARVQKCVIWQL